MSPEPGRKPETGRLLRVRLAQAAILSGVVAALAYLVAHVTDSLEDLVPLAVIAGAVLLIGLALRERRYPAPARKRSILRTPESDW